MTNFEAAAIPALLPVASIDLLFCSAFLIKFPNHFGEGKSVVEGIPEVEYENLLARCLQILPDLSQSLYPAALLRLGQGIPTATSIEHEVMRCPAALLRLGASLDRGKFTNDLPTIQEKKKAYEQASRPIKEYLDEFCVKEDVEYPTWKMQEEYNSDFAPKKGCRTLSKKAFNDALETEGYELFKKEYTDSYAFLPQITHDHR